MKYKAGDRVKVKSSDWYCENANYIDEVNCGNNTVFSSDMKKYCGTTVTIMAKFLIGGYYVIEEDGALHHWNDEMFECNDESDIKEVATKALNIKDEIIIPDNCEAYDDMGNAIKTSKIIIREVKKTYPNTIIDCYNLLEDCELASNSKMRKFQELINARNAYWSIAGNEMGLGKSWKPDWTKADEIKYCIVYKEGNITKRSQKTINKILAFPTEEIRDLFYENFESHIEECKEFI